MKIISKDILTQPFILKYDSFAVNKTRVLRIIMDNDIKNSP